MEENKVIEFPNNENNKNNENVLTSALNALGDVLSNNGEEVDGLQSIGAMLALPEEQFNVLAPHILINVEKELNNLTDKLIIIQALNAQGIRAEDFIEAFSEIATAIDDQLVDISNQKKDFIKSLLGMICNSIADTEGIAKRYIKIPIELCHEDAKMPEYAHLSDSGLDIYALEDIVVKPGETKLVKTGLKVAIPLGYELQVRPKSGRALKTKLRVANTPGTIDAGYRDEIGVIIENIEPAIKDITYESELVDGKPVYTITSIEHGASHYIGKGEKFAQLVLCEVPKAVFYEVEKVSEIGEDRQGGFGSTGLK